jgi:hypothetical protein
VEKGGSARHDDDRVGRDSSLAPPMTQLVEVAFFGFLEATDDAACCREDALCKLEFGVAVILLWLSV